MTEDRPMRWNHNIHYQQRIVDAVPSGAQTALDVGTGNGLLAAALRTRIPNVTGIDTDAGVLDSARTEDPDVTWVLGDVMTHPFAPASFDVVAAVASIHHLPDVDGALARLAELTAPGGLVAVLGPARSSTPLDALHDLAGVVQHAHYERRFGVWEHTAPTVWPPPHTYRQVRRSAARVLPGSTWVRLPMWRSLITWRKPA